MSSRVFICRMLNSGVFNICIGHFFWPERHFMAGRIFFRIVIEIQWTCSFPPVLASSHENEAFPKKSFPPISLLLPHRVLLQLEKKHPPSSHTSEEAKKQQMRGKEQLLCLCGNDSERRGGRGDFLGGWRGKQAPGALCLEPGARLIGFAQCAHSQLLREEPPPGLRVLNFRSTLKHDEPHAWFHSHKVKAHGANCFHRTE